MKALILRAAYPHGVSTSTFLLGATQERARQVLAENESITLTPRDWDAFFAALDDIERPRPRLSAAMQRHRDWRSDRESE